MSLADYSVKHRPVVLFAMLLLIVGGLTAYRQLGKLEDPEFTVKRAMVVTLYPGASPEKVERQVTDKIEKAIQRLDGLDKIESMSRAGMSLIFVDLDESLRGPQMTQKWDELRRKVADVRRELPPDAEVPIVRDDFGDVYGVLLAIYGDDFTYAELKETADLLQRELLRVTDVARVEIFGAQRECVNVEISRAKLAESGIHPKMVFDTLGSQNQTIDAGSVDLRRERVRLAPTGTFESIEEIGNLVVQAPPAGDLVLLRDVATVSRGYLDPPMQLMRFNGKPALGLAISTVSGGNVLDMGDAVNRRLDELKDRLPVGLQIGVVAYQADNVRQAINGFLVNLAESVVIVIVVLLFTMGLRCGWVIGSSLVLTILATLCAMQALGIDLQRTSLGSLILVMGMLVDNAIVVAEGALIRLQKNEPRYDAVVQPAVETAWPLLGATLVAIFAFLPIYLSQNNTGEYCASLFLVVAVSLMISWVLAMTQVPLFCDLMLKTPKPDPDRDPYAGRPYRIYAGILEGALRHRTVTVAVMGGLLAVSLIGFCLVDRIFFPEAVRSQWMIDYRLPEGSRIESVADDLSKIERYMLEQPGVTSAATFVGSGPPRFYLPYEPEVPTACYGQIVVNVAGPKDVDRLLKPTEKYLQENFPQAESRVRRFALGPSTKYEIEARISGDDPVKLRELAEQVKQVMRGRPARNISDNWHNRVKVWEPIYSQPRGRNSLVARSEMALSLRQTTSGLPVGYYREEDRLMPIFIRAPRSEREDVAALENVPIWGHGNQSVPLSQVVGRIDVGAEDPVIHRFNRRRTITIQCDGGDVPQSELFARLRPRVEALPLPPGYELHWGGIHEKSSDAQAMVFSKLPVAGVLMALAVVMLFNGWREPLIILLVLPLAGIGIAAGLLITGQPFGFMALLGGMSLMGMLIKNAVVLLDQINMEIRQGRDAYQAVVHSSISRMRPVMMASLTTVFGMIPLLADPLFSAMAVTIMFGLTFGTVLTLLIVPILYTLLRRIAVPSRKAAKKK